MKLQLYRILKWFSLHIFATISGTLLLSWSGLAVVDLTLAIYLIHVLVEGMRSPTPLWVAITLWVMTYLLLKITISRSSFTPKPKEPDLSKLPKDQEKTLTSLSIAPKATAEDIATATSTNLEVVIHHLENLKDKLLVAKAHQASVYETGWHLTQHGRKYLFDNNLLPPST